jgi:hypothetical protein
MVARRARAPRPPQLSDRQDGLSQGTRELNIERHEFHGDWNYVIKPRKDAVTSCTSCNELLCMMDDLCLCNDEDGGN